MTFHVVLGAQGIDFHVMPSFDRRIDAALVAGVLTVTTVELVLVEPPLIWICASSGGSPTATAAGASNATPTAAAVTTPITRDVARMVVSPRQRTGPTR